MSKQISVSEQALTILEPIRNEFNISYSDAILFISKTDNSLNANIEYINNAFEKLELLKVENSIHEMLRIIYIKAYKKEDITSLCKELIVLCENIKRGVK